jgi:hypothetical protein
MSDCRFKLLTDDALRSDTGLRVGISVRYRLESRGKAAVIGTNGWQKRRVAPEHVRADVQIVLQRFREPVTPPCKQRNLP